MMRILKYRRNLILVLVLVGLGVIAFAWGVRGTAAPGPGSQRYPALGHAPDFSWIAGTLELDTPRICLARNCGCIILRYGEDGQRVQLDAASWSAYRPTNHRALLGTSIVVFGHLIDANQQYYKCPLYPDAQGYIINAVEVNSVP